MADKTLINAQRESNRKWLIVNGRVRPIKATRVGAVCLRLPFSERRSPTVLAGARVFDTEAAANAALTPFDGYVIRDGKLRAEPVIGPLGDGSYQPADRSGYWRGAFTTRAAARAFMSGPTNEPQGRRTVPFSAQHP
jgi:hypothetical protein